MGFLDKLKHAVTGGIAKVDLVKHTGTLEAEGLGYVKVEVEALGALDADGVFVDLHGEDDLDENLLDKAAEIFNPDPEYSWPIGGKFKLAQGDKRVFENSIALPADFAIGKRHWLVRARVAVLGKDPSSEWVLFAEQPSASTPD